MILCVPVNKAYIGQSKNIYRRWTEHRNDLKGQRHGNQYLQNLYNKYGKDSLFYSVLEICDSNITSREIHYLESLDEDFRLNLKGIDEIVPCSEETRKKLSESHKGIPSPNKGRRASEETRKRMSEAHKGNKSHTGRKLSKETREKMSKSHKGKIHCLGPFTT